MTQIRPYLLNFTLVALTTLILSGFQTVFWFQVVGNVPAPLLWLNIVIYLVLYRDFIPALIIAYALALFIVPFSSIKIGEIWMLLFILTCIVNFGKSRLFWPSTRYFVIASFFSTLIYHVCSFIISRIFDANPVGINFYSRFMELLMTPLWAAPVFWLMTYIDQISLAKYSDRGASHEQ